MYCQHCGSNLDENSAFCPNCGASVQQNATQTSNFTQTQQYPPQSYGRPPVNTIQHSMKWFNFLIYFALFASAVLNLFNGIAVFTGSHYGTNGKADFFYGIVSDLKTLDTFMGLATIALAVFAIYTRFRLSGYRKNGPSMITLLYILTSAVNLIYIIGLYAILPEYIVSELDPYSYIIQIIVSAVMIFVNYTYFKKRKKMFVH
jgi:hypothetical protein